MLSIEGKWHASTSTNSLQFQAHAGCLVDELLRLVCLHAQLPHLHHVKVLPQLYLRNLLLFFCDEFRLVDRPWFWCRRFFFFPFGVLERLGTSLKSSERIKRGRCPCHTNFMAIRPWFSFIRRVGYYASINFRLYSISIPTLELSQL